MEASDGQSEERPGRVSTGTERVVYNPKFKRHRVSTVQDFPLGCRRVTTSNFRLSRQIAVDQSSQGKS
ncbi:hypothetical protein J1N35_000877 [Gossypium stocksii]|uniref:Uncharacterized protein n=1 Tax=Gossypium stocksii TaxID=47602 RepID=A0A9D4ALF1_9ROSI